MKPVSTWRDLLEWSPPAEPGRDARLRRFEALLRAYSRRFGPLPAVVKVTGTSGKGSVGALLEAALLADGKAVGLFTSPHLVLPTERIRIGGRDVSLEALDGAAARTGPFFEELVADLGPRFRPSFYEALLVLAFRLFAEAGCGIAVMEAAIGGAYDVLSSVPGPVSAITSVGLDHRDEIGPELADIARDKAGIATPGSALVLGPTIAGVAREEIERSAGRRGVRLVDAADIADEAVRAAGRGLEGHDVEILTETGTITFRLPLAGDFQVDNLKTAFTVLRVLKDLGEVDRLESIAGAARTRWPARLELLPGRPAWLLDSAHNGLAFQALADFLRRSLPEAPRSLLLGASDAEKAGEALRILGPLFPEIHLAGGFYKAVDPRLLRGASGSFPDPESAVRFLRARHAGEERCIVVAGSLYLAGACRSILLADA
jgi:dihydrofolate synthase/folylpolyglutamate synthase